MKRKHKWFVLLLVVVMMMGAMTVQADFSGYGSLSYNGKTATGKSWSGRASISTAEVYGSITCSTAHDVAAIGYVKFVMNGTNYEETVYGVADPGVSTVCRWTAGTGRTARSTSRVVLQVEGAVVN